MSHAIRIALVEDDAELLEGMNSMLASGADVTVAGTFSNAEDFLAHAGQIMPEVVLMDIGLPGMSGIECVAKAKALFPAIQFMMWTTFDDDEKIFDALRSGAAGYLLKNSPPQAIVEAIIDVKRGGSPMSSSIARKVIESFLPKKNASEEYNLTPREREILDWLAKGHRYKEIAARLFISVETVRKHIHNIYEKLHVQSRTEALNKVFHSR
jgi:DNA-binding NarL/FixJ family response regulator